MSESSDNKKTDLPVDLGVCAPGCDCGKPAGSKRSKLVLSLLVLLAAGGILIFKATEAKKEAPVSTGDTFVAPAGPMVLGPAPGTAGLGGAAGGPLASFAALNTVAAGQDSVLVFVPAKEGEAASGETKTAMDGVLRSLQGKGVRTGFYTLATGSLDYGRVAAQTSLPAVVALTKGRGMGTASGPFTEEKLMQAYVASTQAAGCCPPSGGSSAVCPP